MFIRSVNHSQMIDFILLVKLKIATYAGVLCRGHILSNMIRVLQAPWTQNYEQEALVPLSKLYL